MVWIKFNSESKSCKVKIRELDRFAEDGEMLLVNENRAAVLCGENKFHRVFAKRATQYEIEKYHALHSGFTGNFDKFYNDKHDIIDDTKKYDLSVVCTFDGKENCDTTDFGLFEVYINDELVRSNAVNYYETLKAGTKYKIYFTVSKGKCFEDGNLGTKEFNGVIKDDTVIIVPIKTVTKNRYKKKVVNSEGEEKDGSKGQE